MAAELIKFERVDTNFYDKLGISYYVHGGCKFNCDYCFLVGYHRSDKWKSRSAPRGFKHQPTMDQQKDVMDVILKLQTPYFIYLYGGEPTEYKHIHELIEYINRHKTEWLSHVEMQTNLNTTVGDLKLFCSYDNIEISPTLHLDHLKGDTIHDLVDKIDTIYDNSKLARVDFIMAKNSERQVRELHNIFKNKPYFDKILYTRTFLEINSGPGALNYHEHDKDIYTGRFNTGGQFTDICDETIYKETYKLTYSDDTSEVADINRLYDRHMNFKGWVCDAGKKLMLVDYTGDWWICDNEYIKNPPAGNLVQDPKKFVQNTKFPHVCRLDKCDGCFYINRVKPKK